MPAGQMLDPVPPDGALPVMIEMVEPVRRLDQRRTLAGRRESQPGPVPGGAVADDLLGKLRGRIAVRQRLDLIPAAPGRGWLAIFALERAVERRLAVEPDRIS